MSNKVGTCQRCGQVGGKVISFDLHNGAISSRWVCPYCLDDAVVKAVSNKVDTAELGEKAIMVDGPFEGLMVHLTDAEAAVAAAERRGAERERLREPAEGTWQPIETAPNPGTFLVWLPIASIGSHVHGARFHPNVKTVGQQFMFDLESQPTHWMKLPDPPKPD